MIVMKTKLTRKNRKRIFTAAALSLQIFFMMTPAVFAQGVQGQTTRVSVDSTGIQGNDPSGFGSPPSLSADGRFVAFTSRADNLVAGDTNGVEDIFVHDRQTGQTTRVSVDSAGTQGNGPSDFPFISADGRFVAFQSRAGNLVAGDTNFVVDIFVHDRQTGQTTRVSVDSAGTQGNLDSLLPSISADGRFVAFESESNNLVAGDLNFVFHIFVHDRQTGQTTRVDVGLVGIQGNGGESFSPFISADGRFVAFSSFADNLVAGDTNFVPDIFVHDRQTGQTTRVSVDSAGIEGNDFSVFPSISADGRFVAFESFSTNLVAGDTNGSPDIFVHDRQTGQTTRVSVDSAGIEGNSSSENPFISADGRFVAFHSTANNLVVGDSIGNLDSFVHDLQAGQTTRVSVDSAGIEGNGASDLPSISADGRFVGFRSFAINLVAGDSNGELDIFVHNFLTLFSDVQFSHFAFGFVMKILDVGITGGCSVDPPQFCPDSPITRGQMAVFLETSLGHPPNTCEGRFADVPLGHSFCGFVERMADDGITGGCSPGNFCPDGPVTRGQMAVFIEAALGNPANACIGRFPDASTGHPFCGFIERLADDGITGGCTPTAFCPNDPVTRAQMAVFLVAAPAPLSP
jgi:Tol biopolymer transport system component